MADRSTESKLSTRPVLITVLGMGRVGIPAAVGLAELGWRVTGVDKDSGTIALLRTGEMPFSEPGLQELMCQHLKSGRCTRRRKN